MITSYENEKLLEAIPIALKENLYVPGWTLKDTLIDVIDFYKEEIEDNQKIKDKILLYFVDESPVAIIYYNGYSDIAQIFVKPSYRKQGIGTLLIKELHAFINKDLCFCLGNEESYLLFRKFDFVDCRDF